MKTLIIGISIISLLSGCTFLVGVNEVETLSPRGSYRSVDTSGKEAEGLMDMAGGGEVEATASLTQ